MTKKMMKIYLRGLHENCRKKKLRRYKNKIADLEDPLEKENQKIKLFYKVNYEMLTEQLKVKMQENKMLKETLEKEEERRRKTLRKQSNATASVFASDPQIVRCKCGNERGQLLHYFAKTQILRTKILDCEKKPEEDEEEDDESNSANSHDNQVTKNFQSVEATTGLPATSCINKILGSGTAGEANPNYGFECVCIC